MPSYDRNSLRQKELRTATGATTERQQIGWIGAGRMGTPMAERLIKAGYDVAIWNRPRANALAAGMKLESENKKVPTGLEA